MAEEDKPGLGSAEIEERRRRPHEPRLGEVFREFVRRLAERSGWEQAFAQSAAVSVLCHLQQRVDLQPPQEPEPPAAKPSPRSARRLDDLLGVCSVHEALPVERIGQEELLRRVARELKVEPERAELVTREVFAAVRDWLSDTEAEDVEQHLPHDLLPLWHLPF